MTDSQAEANLLNFKNVHRVKLVRQTEMAECGLACIAMVANAHGMALDTSALRRRFSVSPNGMTVKTMLQIADDLGLVARAVRIEPDELQMLTIPAILHWDMHHFVVFIGKRWAWNGPKYKILDPATGERSLGHEELGRHFTGVAVDILPSHRFEKRSPPPKLKVNQLWTKLRGLSAPLFQIGILTILLQFFAFLSPFYLQTAVDDALPSADLSLLTVLALAFAGLAFIQVATNALREVVLMKLGGLLGFQLVSNVFRQLVSLPISYFERRHTGDVISRLDSTHPITDIISHGAISAPIDAIMAVAVLSVMSFYSILLASISALALLLAIATRLIWFRVLQSANVNVISARAAESTTVIETLRGITNVKLFGKEHDRHRLWTSKRADVVNAGIRLGRVQIAFDSVTNIIFLIENICVIFVALRMAFEARFTLGMIFAYQAYKDQFVSAGTRLIAFWVQFRILDVHLGRISDIALSRAEITESPTPSQCKELSGNVEFRNVCFSYGTGEPAVLKGVNLWIEAGQSVAIVGPSGGGKTTLSKLLMGLREPNAGSILIDGQPLNSFGLANLRRQVGSVLQDDVLYLGTLAENISFFEDEIDRELVRDVARIAAIDHEIMAMPMQYDSLVGDMGSSLSGGQKQRVLLARALYRRPRMLVIDEGTAHLDIPTEQAVNENLSRLSITRVTIAHRPDTIRLSQRVLALIDGQITELPNFNSIEDNKIDK